MVLLIKIQELFLINGFNFFYEINLHSRKCSFGSKTAQKIEINAFDWIDLNVIFNESFVLYNQIETSRNVKTHKLYQNCIMTEI